MLATLILSAVFAAPPSASGNREPTLDVAVEKAAREFRIQVYESFRETRDEHDARRALGNELLTTWNKARQPARHREAVLRWFEEAKRSSQLGQKFDPYAELDDLKTLTISEELPADAGEVKPADDQDVKLPPPFVLDLPTTSGEASATVESIFARVMALFSGTSKSDAAEPVPTKSDEK